MQRDLSWLSFNHRVLQEAKDSRVPLMERLKFLAIYSNNLDEFFKVRVATHKHLLALNKSERKDLEYSPKKMLKKIHTIVNNQQLEFTHILENQIIPELQANNIYIKRRLELSENQVSFIEQYFNDYLLPYVQPVLLDKEKITPFLKNASIYLSISLKDLDNHKKKYAIVYVPSKELGRFLELPKREGMHEVILLDDVVRHNISRLFPGYEILDTYSIKLSRDAELYIDDEYSGDLIEKIKTSLNRRRIGEASRFVYDRTMPNEVLSVLQNVFKLQDADCFQEGRYHNNFDFMKFSDFGMNSLKSEPFPPLKSKVFEESNNIFDAIKSKDRMLYYPYHSYEYVVRFFEEASRDPNVEEIRIVQYRVASNSEIMKALMRAVKLGKKVTAFVEVKARFDEEANLYWAEKLAEAGVEILYSMPGIKVHCKIADVKRRELGEDIYYTYLSSGNFHESTAKIYTDIGLFTVDKRITREVGEVFTFLKEVKLPENNFKNLLVGQFNLRTSFVEKIDREISNAKSGKSGYIFAKMNSLEDEEIIDKLYQASSAGVEIRLIVRGICCLKAGVAGKSENIYVTSIVDRFLEHARIFIFHNDGEEEVYVSSADWMYRNLSKRIETAFPIYDEDVKNEIRHFVDVQTSDNVKARIIDTEQKNQYVSNDALVNRSQYTTYDYIKQRENQ